MVAQRPRPIDNTELWLKPIASPAATKSSSATTPNTHGHVVGRWPRTLFFMSDASGPENLWSASVDSATPKELTHFKNGRVLWPSIGAGGKTIVFERDLRHLAHGHGLRQSGKRSPSSSAEPIATPGTTRTTENTFRAMALSPDGKKIAVIAHGQLFAASAKDGGEGQRATTDAVAVASPVWSPDSTSVLYIAERISGAHQLELFNFETGKIRVLTSAPGYVTSPEFSPDGKQIAYAQDDRDLHVLTLPDPKTAQRTRAGQDPHPR